MKILKSRPKNIELIHGLPYPYLNNRRVALFKNPENEYFVKYEWGSNDGPETEYSSITEDEFRKLDAIEYDGSEDAQYASELLEVYCEMLRQHEENEYFNRQFNR